MKKSFIAAGLLALLTAAAVLTAAEQTPTQKPDHPWAAPQSAQVLQLTHAGGRMEAHGEIWPE